MPPIGDSRRYLRLGRQAAKGVLPTGMEDYGWFDSITVADKTEKDIPELKRNNLWQKTRGKTKTTWQEITCVGRIDNVQLGVMLCALAGPPTGPVANTWAFKFGQAQQLPVSAANSMYLALQWGEGLAYSWQALDCEGSSIKLEFAANNTWQITVVFCCKSVTNISQVNTTYDLLADDDFFMPWQTVFSLNSTVFLVSEFSITIDLKRGPLWASALALPVTGQRAGLRPVRFTRGPMDAKYDITVLQETAADYAVNNPVYDAERDLEENGVIQSWNADVDLGAGVYPGFEIDIFKLFGVTPNFDRSKDNVFGKASGEALFSQSDDTGAVFYLTNSRDSYVGT